MGRGQRWESLPSRGQWGRAAGRGLGAPAQERRDPHSAGQPLWAAGWAGALALQEGLGWGLRLRQLTLLLLCWAGPSEWNPLRPLVCLSNAHPRPSSPQLWPFCSAEVGGVGCARVRLVPPRPHKSKRRHMVSRASVCRERAGRLWRSHPRACPGPAQSPGSPPQDTGNPKTDRLEPGTAPTPPRSLEHIRVGTEPAPIRPSLPTAWTTGEGRRHAPAERWGGGSPLPSPPVPPPPSGARLGGGCPGFSPADGERAGQGLCPLAAMLVRGSPGAHRSRGCSL